MAAQRVLLRLAFDGTRFHGSQRQPERPTVDGALLGALDEADMLAEDPAFRAQGRTDRGVSALDYPVAVDATADLETVARTVAGRCQGLLPWAGCPVPEGFDPRREAIARTYRYHWPVTRELDTEAARRAWRVFEGTHDLSAFARMEPHRDPKRTIHRCESWTEGGMLILQVTGQSFLWNQVRRMAGACLDVAEGRLTSADLERALETGARLRVQRTLPAEGLLLMRVDLEVQDRSLAEAYRVGWERLATDHHGMRQRMAVLDAVLGLGGRRAEKR